MTTLPPDPPPGKFYATTSPEYIGELNIRIELFSEPYTPRGLKGWTVIVEEGAVVGPGDDEAEAP